jgi:hypothetical protein
MMFDRRFRTFVGFAIAAFLGTCLWMLIPLAFYVVRFAHG